MKTLLHRQVLRGRYVLRRLWWKLRGRRGPLYRDKADAALAVQVNWVSGFARRPDLVAEYWKVYRSLDEIVAIVGPEGKRVLDVGCGTSTVLHFLPSAGLRAGLDPLAAAYGRIYAYPDPLLIAAGAGEAIPFQDAAFDIVFCTNALDHVEHPAETLAEIRRVLREGGFLVLTVEIFGAVRARDIAHPHAFRYETVRDLLRGGYSVMFERRAPWIGLIRYAAGIRGTRQTELILVCRRTPGSADAESSAELDRGGVAHIDAPRTALHDGILPDE